MPTFAKNIPNPLIQKQVFTGIVEEVGTITEVHHGVQSMRLEVAVPSLLCDAKRGDSVATNGVCLTISTLTKKSFTADLMPETLECSNFRWVKVGDKVNLERAMKVGERFGGHIVSGHIDGVGNVRSISINDNARRVWVNCEDNILKYIVKKGSVALNGVSLTVAQVDNEGFEVSIIPHTWENTSFSTLKQGTEINIENDMIGKYVERLISFQKMRPLQEKITEDFLKEHGFL